MSVGLQEYEAVVLGGGPAGCVAALSLGKGGAGRVLLADADDGTALRIGESIPPESSFVLRQLGLWEGFAAAAHEPCFGSLSCWGSSVVGYNDFVYNVHGTGWHLDRRRFDGQLAAAAQAAGVQVRRGLRFAGIARREDDGFEIQLASATGSCRVRAGSVIDATGGRASFARAMGVRRMFHDRLTCIVGLIDVPEALELTRMTMLEATSYGWWYAARVGPTRVVAALASDAELARAGDFCSAATWTGLLRATEILSSELDGPAAGPESLVVRVAPCGVLERACGPRWAAAGDAASSYDPLSSQGIHSALQDGMRAAAYVASALSGGETDAEEYTDAVHARFAAYVANRDYFYGLERRWPGSSFWRQRRARAPVRREARADAGPNEKERSR